MPACHAGGRRFEPVPDRHFLLKIIDLVGVVKWLRPRVVAPVYVSSNLTIHPIRNFSIQLYMTQGYRQAVRQWILIPSCVGSIPIPATNCGRLAQLGERLPYKQDVIGSSPITPTIIINGVCCH